MLLDKTEIDQLVPLALGGRTPQVYEAKAAETFRAWLGAATAIDSLWAALGPYWPVVQRLILAHHPESFAVREWNGGQPAPDYLSHYDFGDHVRNAIAALTYINRNGQYLDYPQAPHSIELAGDRRLYLPGVGLVDEREDEQVEQLEEPVDE